MESLEFGSGDSDACLHASSPTSTPPTAPQRHSCSPARGQAQVSIRRRVVKITFAFFCFYLLLLLLLPNHLPVSPTTLTLDHVTIDREREEGGQRGRD